MQPEIIVDTVNQAVAATQIFLQYCKKFFVPFARKNYIEDRGEGVAATAVKFYLNFFFLVKLICILQDYRKFLQSCENLYSVTAATHVTLKLPPMNSGEKRVVYESTEGEKARSCVQPNSIILKQKILQIQQLK